MGMVGRSTRDVIVQTPRFAEAARFYEQVLGLPVAHRGDKLVGFETGSFRLYVEPGEPCGPVFEFLVDDVRQTAGRLVAAGCTVEQDDPSVPRCYVRDPYGFTFNLAAGGAAPEPRATSAT